MGSDVSENGTLDAACDEVLGTKPKIGWTMREAWLGGMPDSECARGSGCVCARSDDADEPTDAEQMLAALHPRLDPDVLAALETPKGDRRDSCGDAPCDWEAGYQQGRADAKAEAAPERDVDMVGLRMWALDQAGEIEDAADLVAYVLTGAVPE
jgi:hypothetical protein